jgi:hypothetical protein
MANYNISTLQAGGIGLTFGAMNKAQVAAAQMEISGLEFYREMLPMLNTFNQCALIMKQQQADDQMTQGLINMGSEFAQAAVIGGTAIGAGAFSSKAGNAADEEIAKLSKPELGVELTPETPAQETAALQGKTENLGNVEMENLGRQQEEAKVVKGPQTAEEKAAATKRLEAQQAAQKEYDDKVAKIKTNAEAKQTSIWNTATQMVTPALQSSVRGSFAAWSGAQDAKITRDGAAADYIGSIGSQTITQNLQTISAFISSRDQQEQAAAQAMITMIQLSGPI